VNTIKDIPTQLSSLELSNIAPRANKISAKPSTDLILLEGLKQIWCQAYTAALANLSTLFSYYTRFATGLVKDISQTRSLSLSLY